jgi:ankyrin repeat protein
MMIMQSVKRIVCATLLMASGLLCMDQPLKYAPLGDATSVEEAERAAAQNPNSVYMPNEDGLLPIHVAARNNRYGIFMFYIDPRFVATIQQESLVGLGRSHRAKPRFKPMPVDTRDTNGRTALFHAFEGRAFAIAQELITRRAHFNTIDKQNGNNLLHVSLDASYIHLLAGAPQPHGNEIFEIINTHNYALMTPLEVAAQAGRYDVVTALLRNYARTANPVTNQLNDAVRVAVDRFVDGIRSSWTSGQMADASARLITGILLGNVQEADEAIAAARANSQVDKQTVSTRFMNLVKSTTPFQRFLNEEINGIRPLFAAVAQGNINIIAALLLAGADCNDEMKDAQGRTLFQIAVLLGNLEVLNVIRQARSFAAGSQELIRFAEGLRAQHVHPIPQPVVPVAAAQPAAASILASMSRADSRP